jgi:hypothetical protein
MTPHVRPLAARVKGTAIAPLMYWLVLVYGLALLTALRMDELDKTVPLWVGSVVGTGLGQLLAWRRLRLWLVVFVVVNMVWMVPLLGLPVLIHIERMDHVLEIVLMAFVPAALSGYFSLSERGGLLAFWFPASVWMISILDDGDRGARDGLLLGALAVGLLGFLLAREARRVALWQGHAVQRLAAARSPVVLRTAPLRAVSRIAWVAALAVGTVALTAWIAPHLWQKETLQSKAAVTPPPGETNASPPSSGAAGGGYGEPCCDGVAVEAPRTRVSEYLPLLRPHDDATHGWIPAHCVVCRDGVPFQGGAASGATAGGATAAEPSSVTEPRGPEGLVSPGAPPAAPTPGPAAPDRKPDDVANPYRAPPVAPTPRLAAPAPAPMPKAAPPPALPPPHLPRKAKVSAAPPVVVAVVPVEVSPLAWLLTLALVGTALQLVLRPLRRALLLRHLDRPLWSETVDQRVSNLWQLLLIGLRDAGWVVAPGEQPGELARRVGVAGVETCAAVLDRARHGVRVDAGDLAAMEKAAVEAYRAARGRIGWAARAVSWLRWPLV